MKAQEDHTSDTPCTVRAASGHVMGNLGTICFLSSMQVAERKENAENCETMKSKCVS